jgi:hypothetical protein
LEHQDSGERERFGDWHFVPPLSAYRRADTTSAVINDRNRKPRDATRISLPAVFRHHHRSGLISVAVPSINRGADLSRVASSAATNASRRGSPLQPNTLGYRGRVKMKKLGSIGVFWGQLD